LCRSPEVAADLGEDAQVPRTKVVPVAKALYLCDGHIGLPNQKTDLVGIFNSIRPKTYPHFQKHFVVFAQLIGGLGQVPFYLDVRFAPTGQLVYTSITHVLSFPHRRKTVQMVYTMQGCPFPHPGIYLVEFCDGQWVTDSTLELL
jgi:hypothetical protein